MTKQQLQGHTAILTANIIFGLHPVVSKSLLSDWMSPLGLTMSRLLFGAVIFWVIGLFLPREKIAAKDLLLIALAGIIGFVFTQLALAFSLTYTTPANLSLVVALAPIMVMILSAIFLKETITWKKVLGVILGVTGVFVLVFNARSGSMAANNLLGIALASVNMVCFASYLVIIRHISQKYSSFTLMKWMLLFAAVVLLPFGFHELASQRIYTSEITTTAFLQLAFVLLFSSTLGYFLVPVGLKRIHATTVSMYTNLQPVVASTVAILIGQDVLSWGKPVAGILVITGVIIVTKARSESKTTIAR